MQKILGTSINFIIIYYKKRKDIFLNRQKRGGLYISVNELEIFALKFNIKLSKVEMTSKSLLNRTSEGLYKFSHKSILEYFLSLEGYQNPKFIKNNKNIKMLNYFTICE